MSFLVGATKIAVLALSIMGTTATGGIGLSYTLKNKIADKAREKRIAERNERVEAEKKAKLLQQQRRIEAPLVKKTFKSETIFKKIEGNGSQCWEWKDGIKGTRTALEEEACKKKVQEIWGENSGTQPEKWFKSDPESAISFFTENLSLTWDKYYLLRGEEKDNWETGTFLCSHKKDKDDKELIVISCNKKSDFHYRRK
ncbi:hypothetical protein MSUIS_01450 [Mycoplasma suis KI3806]|uniref:Uncharacterized protein n=1 Tax=Mycoplasma suis (strain KI_3806) TaxID=708248 RepID=F0V316_MYCS3|nr:hypothetical protein [Mycoplasma suis]CBZ40238.1 hypothetical protein MSUIS_01450 [Mycoplasma suis KI3806]